MAKYINQTNIFWNPEKGPKPPEGRCPKCNDKGLPDGCPLCGRKR